MKFSVVLYRASDEFCREMLLRMPFDDSKLRGT